VKKIRLAVVLPVKDDVTSLKILIGQIRECFIDRNVDLHFTIIDDHSQIPIRPKDLFPKIDLKIVRNPYNQGHQKSIITGLSELRHNTRIDYVAVMDADGEDDPNHLPVLLEILTKNTSTVGIIAVRGSRHSTWKFFFSYKFFQQLFLVLIGKKFGSGNFMMFTANSINTLLTIPKNKLSLVASAIRHVDNLGYVRLDRGRRIDGSSKMSLTRLVDHALSIFAVFADLILLRILLLIAVLSFLLSIGVATIVVLKTLGSFELVAGVTSSILIQLLSVFFLFLNFALFSTISILILKRLEDR